jgi:glycosyltransferase involved in cell wall biosynthesis
MPGVMPLLWAMAAGLPVIAEDSDAVRGIVQNGVTGLLVPQADIAGTAERLLELVDDRDSAQRLGTAARQTINASFHVRDYCARLEHVYQRVARGLPAHVVAKEDPDAHSELRPLAHASAS